MLFNSSEIHTTFIKIHTEPAKVHTELEKIHTEPEKNRIRFIKCYTAITKICTTFAIFHTKNKKSHTEISRYYTEFTNFHIENTTCSISNQSPGLKPMAQSANRPKGRTKCQIDKQPCTIVYFIFKFGQ